MKTGIYIVEIREHYKKISINEIRDYDEMRARVETMALARFPGGNMCFP